MLMGMEKGVADVENSMAVPQIIKNRIIISSSNSSLGYIPKRTERRVSKRYLYHVHSSITIAKNVRATQVSLKGK